MNGKKNPQRFWFKKANQRNFLDDLAKKLSIQFPSDWGRITAQELSSHGGGTLLKNFGGSSFKMLKTIYSEEWFTNKKHPRYFWLSYENRKRILNELAKKFKIEKPSDWGKVTYKQIAEAGYSSLIILYDGSIMKTLKEVFPEIEWKEKWFVNIKQNYNYWTILSNQKEFLNNIERDYQIFKPSDWKRVSVSLIRKRGGKGLLSIFNNSLINALVNVYPHHNWQLEFKRNEKKEEELEMIHSLSFLFPCSLILRKYKHPKLPPHKSNLKIELDAWVPEFNLAFEYQGKQHYKEMFSISPILQKSRDLSRREACRELGITLIEVPYWWNCDSLSKEATLFATIATARPDLLPFLNFHKT